MTPLKVCVHDVFFFLLFHVFMMYSSFCYMFHVFMMYFSFCYVSCVHDTLYNLFYVSCVQPEIVNGINPPNLYATVRQHL